MCVRVFARTHARVRACVRVCVQGSSNRKTLVCASSENSRESVRSLETALICADFYDIVRNQSIFYTYCMYSKKIPIAISLKHLDEIRHL